MCSSRPKRRPADATASKNGDASTAAAEDGRPPASPEQPSPDAEENRAAGCGAEAPAEAGAAAVGSLQYLSQFKWGVERLTARFQPFLERWGLSPFAEDCVYSNSKLERIFLEVLLVSAKNTLTVFCNFSKTII